ncbi:MAG: SRPBCC domain-containing protein [Alphaproteobacteria bacterium]|nr:SRPBCC domain-containing protein [Alphaproteobacteria bacterium]
MFAAWTDPRSMAAWMNVEPGPAHSVELDLRVGGALRIWMGRDGARQVEITGEFVAVEPPRRLAFTWRGSFPPGADSLVTVTLAAVGHHETELVLEHERLPSAQSTKGHEAGWISISNRLAECLSSTAGRNQ